MEQLTSVSRTISFAGFTEHQTKAIRSFTSKYNITRLVWFEIYDDPISAISARKN